MENMGNEERKVGLDRKTIAHWQAEWKRLLTRELIINKCYWGLWGAPVN